MIKEVVILSGKGGTGKTSLTAAFASIAEDMVLCDADVDAADLHLLAHPDILKRSDFIGGNEAIINTDKCTQCGTCIDLCQFTAIGDNFEVNALDCEGCGVCVDLCPEQAIDFPQTLCGEYYLSDTRFGPMVHARLGIAQENSGKLVALVRQEAKNLCKEKNYELIITDGPPGIGCPVIASIGQATAILIVTEPTVSGIHDLKRLVELAQHFKIPAMICINKFDLNLDQSKAIEKFALEKGISILGKIPFDPVFIESMVQGKTIIEHDKESQVSQAIIQIWSKAMADPAMKKIQIC